MSAESNLTYEIDREVALHFRDEFREARAAALKDAEGYQQILFVLERFGAYMFEGGCCREHEHSKKPQGLDDYKECIIDLVKEHHPLEKSRKNPARWSELYRDIHAAFGSLYEMVMHGRNEALHQGAFARILTLHLVDVALFLEDTLMAIMGSKIKDYMVRNPVYAYAWQPVSFVRQLMLANSFSYIPVYMKKKAIEEKAWHIIADYHIAEYLRLADSDERKKRLAKSIEKAIGANEMTIEEADTCRPDKTVKDVLERITGKPILVVAKRDNCDELLGIATAFDLM